jgi:hypothetical protein
MPSSYLRTVAPKWAASANATVEGVTVQFFPLPLEGTVNVSSSSVVISGFNFANTQFLPTATRREELKVKDTVLIRPLGTGNFTNARVVTVITDAANLNVNYAMNASETAQTMVRAKYFVVSGTDGWVSAKYLMGNANTTAAASNATLTGYGSNWANDLVVGDKIVILGQNVIDAVTVTAVTNNTTITLNANVLVTNNHAVFKVIETLQTLPNLENTLP